MFTGRLHVSLDKSEVTTDRGEELKLTCQSRSEPAISIEWTKDGEPITDSRIEVMENELVIRELRVADSGEYTCTASRGLDSVSATAVVKVKGEPKVNRVRSYLSLLVMVCLIGMLVVNVSETRGVERCL